MNNSEYIPFPWDKLPKSGTTRSLCNLIDLHPILYFSENMIAR